MIIKARTLINDAIRDISQYFTGEKKPLKTRYEHFNANLLGGIYSQMVITIGAISGVGKTYVLQQIEEDIMNPLMNPNNDVVLLRANWEMSVRALLLRKISQRLKKTISSILQREPTDTEKAGYSKVADEEKNNDIYYMNEPCDPEEFFKQVDAFLHEHQDRNNVIVTIDHIALVKSMLGSTKLSMDKLLGYINILKNRYKNVSFIILSQLNREIEARTKAIEAAPRRGDFYSTDTIFHLSDMVIVLHDPYKIMNMDRYMMVDTKRYAHLTEHLVSSTANRSNFLTEDRMFWHYLKRREQEDASDIYIEDKNIG